MAVNWGNSYQVVLNSDEIDPSQNQWHLRFLPQSVEALIGNSESKSALLKWFKGCTFDSNLTRLAVVHGPVGVGKSLCVELMAKLIGKSLIRIDCDEHRSVVAMEGLIRRAYCEKSILFIDDVHRLCDFQSGLQNLVKLIKTGTFSLNVICCFDGDILDYPKLNPLMNISNLNVEFDPLSCTEIMMVLKRITKSAGAELGYFDAMRIAQQCNGDVRSAIINAEFLFQSRNIHIQNLKRKRPAGYNPNRILTMSGICENGSLPGCAVASNMLMKGTKHTKSIIDASECEGVRYTRELANRVEPNWLNFVNADRSDECMETCFRVMDSLGTLDILCSSGLSLEDCEYVKDAELSEFAFRPQIASSILCSALKKSDQMNTEQIPVKRRRRKIKLNYP